MDHYGIGQAMRGMAAAYFSTSRSTGRTSSLVESLKNGDRVCFMNNREAERVKRICKKRGVDIECIVVTPGDPHRLFERGTGEGRFLFDHSWVEEFYLQKLDEARKDIDSFQTQLSGYGAAHHETKRFFEELHKWPIP